MLITLEQLYNVYCAVHYNNYSIVNSFTGFIIYRTQVDNRQLPIAMWAGLQTYKPRREHAIRSKPRRQDVHNMVALHHNTAI